ncbi:MAG: ThiF family adenylyltransferase, partial [Proteobacteria bacterium]|nr:ThiF family adenylyltransferase [Pseudomonadota bacterium]
STLQAYRDEAFSRNIGLLSKEEQDLLADTRVAIPGMGGVGGLHLITLTRTGVGKFNLADFDIFEPVNVNRQYGARIPDFGKPKLKVMVEEAISINPHLEIREFSEGINKENIDDFLDGVQVVIDGLDFFNFDARRLLFNRAREKGIYVITAGPLGFSSALLVFAPDEGMGFDEYFDIHEGMTPQEKLLSFGLGLAPGATHMKYMDLSRVDLDSKAGPSLSPACQLCASLAATEVLKIVLNRGETKPVPYYVQIDPYLRKCRKGYLYKGNRNPIQQLKKKYVGMKLMKKKDITKIVAPEPPTMPVTAKKIPDEVIRYIIEAGIRAPSGDNAQPEEFSIKGNCINLYLDRDADTSFFNVNQIASIISCGAVLENMRIAATAFGLETRIVYLPDVKDENLMAAVDLDLADVPKDFLFDSVWGRHTNRKLYDKKPVPETILHELKDVAESVPGVKLHLVSNREQLKKVARIVYKADRIRTEHRPLHEHLCKMIRFTDADAREKGDGLPLKNLEAGLAGEVFLKATRPWKVMNLVNRIGLGRMVALHSYQSILNSSGVALLTVQGMGIEDFLKGGQALERVWLGLTQKGLSMQPMTAVTLFWLRWQIEGENAFSEDHRRLLRETFEEYRKLFSNVSFEREGHVLLFRLGYGKEIKYRTYRKDVESFLRKESIFQ